MITNLEPLSCVEIMISWLPLSCLRANRACGVKLSRTLRTLAGLKSSNLTLMRNASRCGFLDGGALYPELTLTDENKPTFSSGFYGIRMKFYARAPSGTKDVFWKPGKLTFVEKRRSTGTMV